MFSQGKLPLGGTAPRIRTNLTGTPSRRFGNGPLSEPRRREISRQVSNAAEDCKSLLKYADDDDVANYISSMHASSSKRSNLLNVAVSLIILAVFVVGSYYSRQFEKTHTALKAINKESSTLKSSLQEIKARLAESEDRTLKLTQSKNEMLEQLEELGTGNYKPDGKIAAIVDTYGGASLYSSPVVTHAGTSFFIDSSSLPEVERKRREQAQLKRAEILKTNIQEISKRELLDRYGPGPHRVEFTLAFFDQNQENGEIKKRAPSKFVVETAPANLMPHSVLLFLEMIHHRLWDDTAIVHNKDHVLTASPTNFFTGESKLEQFESSGFRHVSFQEYSEHFPHEQYTLGFTGRPGGPDFYISIDDNTSKHGPGGFPHAAIEEEADPCFAKVVQGFDTIKRIYTEGANSDIGVNIVGIISADILPPRDYNSRNIDLSHR